MTFIKSIKTELKNITLKQYDPPAPELLITDQECISIAFFGYGNNRCEQGE
mgnify:CR=1 FL=1